MYFWVLWLQICQDQQRCYAVTPAWRSAPHVLLQHHCGPRASLLHPNLAGCWTGGREKCNDCGDHVCRDGSSVTFQLLCWTALVGSVGQNHIAKKTCQEDAKKMAEMRHRPCYFTSGGACHDDTITTTSCSALLCSLSYILSLSAFCIYIIVI